MADFDPDKYLAKKEAQFDPDKYLATRAPEEPSQLEAALRGTGQGISLGLIDEITAALEASGGSLGILPDKTYEQAREESRRAYKAAEEAHPATYLAGEIGGGLAVPGMGAIGSLGKGATGLAKVGTRALEGAALGGIGAYGTTEEEGAQALAEAGKGAALGGVVAPVAGAMLDKIIPTLKWTGEKVAGKDVIGRAYEKAKAGQSLAGDEAKELATKDILDFIRGPLAKTVDKDVGSVVNEAYGAVKKKAAAKGKAIKIEDLLAEAKTIADNKLISPDKRKDVLDTITMIGKEVEVPSAIKQVKPVTIDPEVAHMTEQERLADEYIKKQRAAIERTQDVKEMKSQLARAGEPSMPSGEVPEVYAGKGPAFESDLIAAKSQSASPTIKAVKPFEAKPYTPRGEKSVIDYEYSKVMTNPNADVNDLFTLRDRLQELATAGDPYAETMIKNVKSKINTLAGDESLLKNADELYKLKSEIDAKFKNLDALPIATKDRSKVDSIARQISSAMQSTAKGDASSAVLLKEGFDALKKIPGLEQTAMDLEKQLQDKALNLEVAGLLGKGINPIHPTGMSFKPLVAGAADIAGKGAKRIHDMTDNELGNVVKTLYSAGKDTYAKMLERAMLAPGEKKRALIFSLTQNPEFRNSLPGSGE